METPEKSTTEEGNDLGSSLEAPFGHDLDLTVSAPCMF